MLDLLREIGQTLRRNKLRTALTGFAVAWGIFMLIVLLGMSRGVYNGFTNMASLETSSVISMWPGITSKAYKGYKEGRKIELKTSDKPQLTENGGRHVADVWQTKVIDSAYISSADEYISCSLYGHFPQEEKRAKIEMLYGRFINRRDLDLKRKVMVLNDNNASILFGSSEAALGQRVSAYGLSWRIIGVYHHEWENGTYIPFTTAMAIKGDDGTVSQADVKIQHVATMADGEEAERDIRRTMAAIHDFDPDDESGIYTWNRFTNYMSGLTAMNILQIAVWLIGLFTLLSGIVGVSNIMFVSVRERTHEIGIRRAIGAKPRAILSQVIAESVGMTTLFGYIGIVAGMIVLQIVDMLTKDVEGFTNPTVDISIAVKVTLALIIAGALAGLFPALNAIKVKPVEALRDE